MFPGKPTTKKKKKKKIHTKLDSLDKDITSTEPSAVPKNYDVPDDAEGERIIRKSTRTAVIVRQAERDAIRAALQSTMKVSSISWSVLLLGLIHCIIFFCCIYFGEDLLLYLTIFLEAFLSCFHRMTR